MPEKITQIGKVASRQKMKGFARLREQKNGVSLYIFATLSLVLYADKWAGN